MRLYWEQVWAVAWKDLVVELRSRERVAAMAGFTVLVGVLFNYAIDPTLVRAQDVASGLVCVTVVFGGTLGLGRTFELEAQDVDDVHAGEAGAQVGVNFDGQAVGVAAGFADHDRDCPPPVGAIVGLRFRQLSATGVPVGAAYAGARPDDAPTLPLPAALPGRPPSE